MAENKIKVNELQTATPQLSDTLLASGAEREYACRISDLKDAIGGGGGGGDWNANEGEEGYIANRTHYETVNETEVTHTFTIPNDYSEDFYEETNPEDDAIIEAIYNAYVADAEDTTGEFPVFISSGKININETENDCYLYLRKTSAESAWCVYFLDKEVDASSWDEINAAEIIIIAHNPTGEFMIGYIVSHFNVGQNEISCAVIQTTVKKIDPKYLPKGLKNIKDDNNSGIIEGLIEGNDGEVNVASGQYAHAEGGAVLTDEYSGQTVYLISTASGVASHAEGGLTTASGMASHAEGNSTTASGEYSHAEGMESVASGYYSHAEGMESVASGQDSHAEGYNTTASGMASHAEGNSTKALGDLSHAEGGSNTTASGNTSHAEGYDTTASGKASHAEGSWTIANHQSQHVFGEYNIADPSTNAANQRGNYVEIVGNGTTSSAKSNARTLDWSGNEEIAGTFLAKGGILLKSPDGSTFTLTVGNDGTLTATKNT